MNLLEMGLALAPTFLKQELIIARNEHRSPSFEAVAEDSLRMAKALLAEYEDIVSDEETLHIVNSSIKRSGCIQGFKRHLSKGDGICIRCGKQFRTNAYKKKTA